MARAKADPAANGEGLSKMKMVEQVIEDRGNVSPREIQAEVLEKHGVELPTTMISSYKSNILKKQAGGGGGGGDGRAGGDDAKISVKDVAALQELIDRVGATQLQTFIKVLAK